MRIVKIDHVQLAMPAGQEDLARAFYHGLLGIPELPKPANLAKRGGVWFERGALKVHLGVQADFRPATKAHIAFETRELDRLIEDSRRAGYPVVDDEPLAGYQRVYISDPFGNRLEFLARSGDRAKRHGHSTGRRMPD